jgi:hypothetical protein
MAILTKEQLAERGALSAILDLRAEIEAIQAAYPSVVQAERVAKMKATIASKGASGAEGHAKPGPKPGPKAVKDPNAPKKSHHKKKPAPVALGEAVKAAAAGQAVEGAAPETADPAVAMAVAEVGTEAVAQG